MVKTNEISPTKRQSTDTAGAVGVNSRQWFVAIVNNNTEQACSRKLLTFGYQSFVPIQEFVTVINGKRRKRTHVAISSLLFVHVTEQERKDIVNLPFIKRFMTDHTRPKDFCGRHPLMTIPDCQMEPLRNLIDNCEEEIRIESLPKNIGEKVRITGGKLKGLTGNVIRLSDGKTFFVIQLENLGCAKVLINPHFLKAVR